MKCWIALCVGVVAMSSQMQAEEPASPDSPLAVKTLIIEGAAEGVQYTQNVNVVGRDLIEQAIEEATGKEVIGCRFNKETRTLRVALKGVRGEVFKATNISNCSQLNSRFRTEPLTLAEEKAKIIFFALARTQPEHTPKGSLRPGTEIADFKPQGKTMFEVVLSIPAKSLKVSQR
ncbi:MAG: hypothetical protein ACRD4B_07330 [Acidobacteriota bacterium]